MMINDEKCKWLGKGQFSTAYRSIDNPDTVYLITNEDDNLREVYVHSGHKHIPHMEKIAGSVWFKGRYVNIWKMPYYRPISRKDSCWQQYKKLYDAWQEIYTPLLSAYFYTKDYNNSYRAAEQFIQMLESTNMLDSELLYALERIKIWASCFGSGYIFEFQQKNIGVDQDGNLILRDVVFMNPLATC